MQDPSKEITTVVTLLTTAVSPDIQKATAERYLTPDIGFRHPLCNVIPSPTSRESLLGIYQWYRVMSPKIEAEVRSVVHDKEKNVVFLDVVQTFHIRFSPLKPAMSRLLVRLTLREIGGLYYISFQEDFYHPDDFASLLIPPLAPLIRLALNGTSLASNVYAKIAQTMGFWSVSDRAEHISEQHDGATGTNGQDKYKKKDTGGLYDGNKRQDKYKEKDIGGLYDGNKTD